MVTRQKEVMVIDDERDARTYLVELLELEGFKVAAFTNGAEALDYLEHSALPCLIILDLRMPVMDGPQFRRAMLRDPRLSEIPVVVVTAFERSAAADMSAIRVFRKPVDLDALLETVRENC
jgi:CheY-like chemotaxis protein